MGKSKSMPGYVHAPRMQTGMDPWAQKSNGMHVWSLKLTCLYALCKLTVERASWSNWINLYVDSLHSNLGEICVDLT